MVEADPELPDGFEYLWEWFAALSSRRTGSGFGPNPIQSEQILAWAQLMQIDINPWEFECLCAVDNTYMAEQARRIEARANRTKKAPKPSPDQKPNRTPRGR